MSRQYLQDGDRVYTTGAYLIWDTWNRCFTIDYIDDDMFFDGETVYQDENDRLYIERDEK